MSKAKTGETRIALPMPPSTNNLYVNVRGKGRVRSENYRKWNTEAGWTLVAQRPKRFDCPVRVAIEICPEGRGVFDIDNKNKAILDLLVQHDVITDDNRLTVRELVTRIVPKGAPCTVVVEAI